MKSPFFTGIKNVGILTAQLSVFRKQEHLPSFHFVENNLSHDLQKLVLDNLKTGLLYLHRLFHTKYNTDVLLLNN